MKRVNLRGEAKTLGVPKVMVRVTLVEDEGQPPALLEQEHQRRHLRVSSRVKNRLFAPPLALAAPTRTLTPRSASSAGTPSA